MKTLFGVIVLLLVVIAGLGFYRGWFHLSTNSTGQKSSATVTVDRDKIKADEGKVKEKVGELGQKTKEKTSDRTGIVTEGERRP
jgi:predicted negative regulator of RcsB-dependent stress response